MCCRHRRRRRLSVRINNGGLSPTSGLGRRTPAAKEQPPKKNEKARSQTLRQSWSARGSTGLRRVAGRNTTRAAQFQEEKRKIAERKTKIAKRLWARHGKSRHYCPRRNVDLTRHGGLVLCIRSFLFFLSSRERLPPLGVSSTYFAVFEKTEFLNYGLRHLCGTRGVSIGAKIAVLGWHVRLSPFKQ